MPEVIYCAAKNIKFAQIAEDHGFTYGAQLPNKVYFRPDFVDQNWKDPDLEKYVEAVALCKPRLATVLDWERWSQLGTVLLWAWTVAPYVSEAIIIIPKVRFARTGWQAYIPKEICGLEVRLGYSVPTKYAATSVKLTEFLRWPVHLLGGSPAVQAKLSGLGRSQSRLLDAPTLNVVSVDGNYHQSMANRNQFFVPDGSARYANNRYWPTLKEADGVKWGDGSKKANAPYEAFRRSCKAIMDMWG